VYSAVVMPADDTISPIGVQSDSTAAAGPRLAPP
jgi:hypothetical protein